MTRDEAAKRLNECSKNLDVGVFRSEWMTPRNQPTDFMSYINIKIHTDLAEVEKNPTDAGLTNLIKERIKFKLRTILENLEDRK